jgi:hypothetical protein
MDRAAALGNAAGALATTQLSHDGVVSREDTLRLMAAAGKNGEGWHDPT